MKINYKILSLFILAFFLDANPMTQEQSNYNLIKKRIAIIRENALQTEKNQ
jgi:hypothetical protein